MTLWKHPLIAGETATQFAAEQQTFLPNEKDVVVRNGAANRLIIASFGKTQKSRQRPSRDKDIDWLVQRGNRNGSLRERQTLTIRRNHAEHRVFDFQESARKSGIGGFRRNRDGGLLDESCQHAG